MASLAGAEVGQAWAEHMLRAGRRPLSEEMLHRPPKTGGVCSAKKRCLCFRASKLSAVDQMFSSVAEVPIRPELRGVVSESVANPGFAGTSPVVPVAM
jgi:hypothetical protein